MATSTGDATASRKFKWRGQCSAISKVHTMYIARLPVSECRRLIAKALNESVTELRKDNDTRMSKYVHTEPPEWHMLTWCYSYVSKGSTLV